MGPMAGEGLGVVSSHEPVRGRADTGARDGEPVLSPPSPCGLLGVGEKEKVLVGSSTSVGNGSEGWSKPCPGGLGRVVAMVLVMVVVVVVVVLSSEMEVWSAPLYLVECVISVEGRELFDENCRKKFRVRAVERHRE